MKSKINSLSAVFFVLIFVFLVSYGTQKAEWKGEITTENGVKVVKNPRESLYGELVFDLEEDLSIGREDDENYLFYRVFDIEVDNQGNIYVPDSMNYRIQKFDKNGKYLQTISRIGQRPIEFEFPFKIRINQNNGNIFILDRFRNFYIFDERGNYLRSIPQVLLNALYLDFLLTRNNNLFIKLIKSTESGDTHTLLKINSKGEGLTTLAEFSFNTHTIKEGDAYISLQTGFEFSLWFTKIDEYTFAYGYSKEYELNVINAAGELLYKIQKDEPKPEFTLKQKNYFKRIRIPLLEYKPYFFSLLSDSKERIYVQRNMAMTRGRAIDREEKKVDVFSKDGYFLFKTTLPPNTRVIRDGLLYVFEENEEDDMEYIKRYKIKNWDQIKERP